MNNGEKEGSQDSPLLRAIRIAGGQVALAESLTRGDGGCERRITQQAVSHWVKVGYTPPDIALAISRMTRGRVVAVDLIDATLREIVETLAEAKAAA